MGPLPCSTLAGHAERIYYSLLIMAMMPSGVVSVTYIALAGKKHRVPDGRRSSLSRTAATLAGYYGCPGDDAGRRPVGAPVRGRASKLPRRSAAAEVIGWAYPWRNVATFLIPDFYGNPSDHAYRDVFTGATVPFELNSYGQLNPHGPYTSSWGTKNYVEGASYSGDIAVGAGRHWRVGPAGMATITPHPTQPDRLFRRAVDHFGGFHLWYTALRPRFFMACRL
ncbi:MAG: hypothetical protein R3C44_07110 [Chloroflexota bacterium]